MSSVATNFVLYLRSGLPFEVEESIRCIIKQRPR